MAAKISAPFAKLAFTGSFPLPKAQINKRIKPIIGRLVRKRVNAQSLGDISELLIIIGFD